MGTRPGVFRRAVNASMLVLNLLVGAGLFVTAYSGCVPPAEYPLAGIAVLTFPIWLCLTALLLVVDFIWWRKTSLVLLAAIAATGPMVWATCPLNIGGGIPDGTPVERVFTLMTYNTYNFVDRTGEYAGARNPTLSYILDADADVVCLQEVKFFERQPEIFMTGEQLDSLHARYPYVVLGGYAGAILSKYPLTPIRMDTRGEPGSYFDAAGYVLEVEGRRLAVFSVHMQSYNLSSDDKEAYRDITRLHTDEAGVLRHSVLGKLEQAARFRAEQAHMLCRYVEHYGGSNVIVCGDFNDVPGCYTLRTLADIGMREVWPEVGFGPVWTYNDNRFYFRIDHVLWRGDLRPVDVERGGKRYSDHYPLLTTFVWDSDAADNR